MRIPGRYILCLALAIFSWQFAFAQSDGGFTTGSNAYCDSVNSGFISLNNYVGNILYWEQSTNGQSTWQQIQNTTSTQSYLNLKITTSFRAIVQDPGFPNDTSSASTISVHVPGIAGVVTGGGRFCAGANNGTLQLNGTSGNVLYWQYLEETVWQNVNNQTFALNFSNITKQRVYRVVVQRVAGCDADTSATELIEIDEPTITGNITGGDTLCFGSAGDTLVISGHRGTVTDWLISPGEMSAWTSTQHTGPELVYPAVTDTKWYAAVVKNGVCASDTTPEQIVAAYPEVFAEAGPDATITRRESVLLQGSGNGSPLWSPSAGLSDSSSFSPYATPAESTTYSLFVTDLNGCSDIDSVKITVEIPIPTAITPNGDGVNDRFEIYQVEKFEKSSLKIYNRWGQLIYESSPYRNEWNGITSGGSAADDGTYFYSFDYGRGEKPATGNILIKRQ